MHVLTIFCSLLVIDVVHYEHAITRGQHFGFAPPRHFKYIQMDLLHRGSFNTTDCVKEWLNCWEVVKADVICSRADVYESICGPMRFDCHEHHGWVERNELPIFESFCKTYNRPT
ncbi:uncharacterized protein LOC123665023 [Melitaea cinxia]|uniref:uncharacterized protein LOC123665023 n=1 Tax=Melitaea cinxia TaxID=113334 RepID=UPI001E2728BE|nr:uncharacterized protein LOC123665023 [Melitaea cinxia]